jgi:hypothetical protein
LRSIGVDDPPVPGSDGSSLSALIALFERAGLKQVQAAPINVTVPCSSFAELWAAQTAGSSPLGNTVAELTPADRAKVIDAMRTCVPASRNGRISYSARANAVQGRVRV